MNDEELEELDELEDSEELEDDSSIDSFSRGYNAASDAVDDAVERYKNYKNDQKLKNSDLEQAENLNNNQNLNSNQIENSNNIQNNNLNQNMQNTANNNQVKNLNNNQNISNNANDLVMKDRINSLKNGGNEATKEAINKGVSNASSNAGLQAQIASSAKNISDDMRQPTVDKEGNELDGIDAAKQKGLDFSKSVGREAGNIAGEVVSDYFTAASGGLSQVFKPVVKAVAAKTSEIATVHATKQLYAIIGIIFGIIILLILSVLFISLLSSENLGGGGSESVSYVAGYEKCSSITVSGLGTYSLEDYVAGVVEHEAYKDGGIEALKAQAVAARTYAINSTKNCTTSIGNSQASQTFSANPSEISKQAANETAGQVLTYDEKVFSTMYDSFCYNDKDCPDAVKNDDGTYSVTYKKLPNKETHTITLSDTKQYSRIVEGGGHASGMSQLVSYQMAASGKKYDEILKFFYSSNVKISSIVRKSSPGTLGKFNGSFNIRTSKPLWLNSPENNYYNQTINGSNWFQCVWYAKARAYEILTTMTKANETRRQTAIEALLNAHGHGSHWYNNAQNDGSMSIFSSSDDYTKPRPGAMVSWKWNSSGCISYYGHNCSNDSENYGHVAIVESVDETKKTVVISDGWYRCGSWNNYDCFGFRSKEYTYDYINKFGGNYIFLGYVYLTDYVGGS